MHLLLPSQAPPPPPMEDFPEPRTPPPPPPPTPQPGPPPPLKDIHPQEQEEEGSRGRRGGDFDELDLRSMSGPESPLQDLHPPDQGDPRAQTELLRPHHHLPQPLAPPGLGTITQFHITNLKVTVTKLGEGEEAAPEELPGRITFFSRSSCRDCGAVRSFLRARGLPYVEINVDVFPARERELRERAGGKCAVPQVFFNGRLVGGLSELNAMRSGGELERRMREAVAGEARGEGAPAVPIYGADDDEEGEEDAAAGAVRELREKVRIREAVLRRMRVVRRCFEGREMVEVLIHYLDCGRKKAVEFGKELLRKHFIHHVFRELDFEDGNSLYRLLEHDPMVSRCYNFRVATNDYEPKPASLVSQHLTKLMFAILEAYASEDRRRLDYRQIGFSEEFRRYVNAVHDLQRVDLFTLSADERLAFFLNLYNAMAIHAVIRIGSPEGILERRAIFNDFHYMVGGYPYSLSIIKNGILRANSRAPYSLAKPFGAVDKRLELLLPRPNPLIHFGLCNATRSSPAVRFFSSDGVEAELRQATREFFLSGGVEVDLDKRTVYLTKIIKWFSTDFLPERELLKWILNFIDSTKAGSLIHLLSDGGPVNIIYQNYDWSLNI